MEPKAKRLAVPPVRRSLGSLPLRLPPLRFRWLKWLGQLPSQQKRRLHHRRSTTIRLLPLRQLIFQAHLRREIGKRARVLHRGMLGHQLALSSKLHLKSLPKPTDTFRSMTPEGGLGRPLVYAAIVGVMGGLAVASLLFLLFSAMTVQGGAGGNSPSLLGGGLAILLIPIFYAVVLPIGALIGGGFLHGMLVLVGAKKYSYTATTRCLCYIYFSCWPLAIFMVIPILNLLLILPIIGWVVALYIIGLAEVHESTKGKVAIAVLIPFAFFFVLGIVAAILGEPV